MGLIEKVHNAELRQGHFLIDGEDISTPFDRVISTISYLLSHPFYFPKKVARAIRRAY